MSRTYFVFREVIDSMSLTAARTSGGNISLLPMNRIRTPYFSSRSLSSLSASVGKNKGSKRNPKYRSSELTYPCCASSDNFVLASPISASTSSCDLLKLSIENAYTVTARIFNLRQISSVYHQSQPSRSFRGSVFVFGIGGLTRFKDSNPSECPSLAFCPLPLAYRLLPSMTKATCFGIGPSETIKMSEEVSQAKMR